MASEDRSQMPFRLPPDQMRRLEKVAHSVGKTKQQFIQETVLERVSEVEESRRMKRSSSDEPSSPLRREERQARHANGDGLGMGISGTLKRQAQAAREVVEPPTSAPVIVNVGGSAASPSGEVDRLAAYVVSGGTDLGRDMRLRTAVEVLHSTAANPEERRVLSAKLDEAVAARLRAPAHADSGSSLASAARVTFDKLAALWKGDS